MPEDLFGSTDLDPPPKGGPDYLTWLNNLDLPDGLKFWCLSTERLAPGVPKQHVEVIIAVDPSDEKQLWHQLVIDLRTGRKYEAGR
jgi:hypothetical protein